MKVEIWSDVVCPFCYIGKRRFEKALAEFPHAQQVKVEWKSFQLSPYTETDPTIHINQYLAAHKGISVTEAAKMNDQVTEMARQEGLEYHFDNVVVANTFNAHRFIHFAKSHGKQGAAKERLLRAYFTEGRNIDDLPTLAELGTGLGLDEAGLQAALHGDGHTAEVKADLREARQLGIQGVPFFVFDRKYGISGAHDPQKFLEVLSKAYAEWQSNHQADLNVTSGQSCAADGECE